MAAMQWVGVPPLAAAVSRSGGLGNITALSQPNPSALRIAIQHLRQDARGNPFCVNITTLPAIKPPDYLGYAKAAVEEGVKVVELAGIICEWPFFGGKGMFVDWVFYFSCSNRYAFDQVFQRTRMYGHL